MADYDIVIIGGSPAGRYAAAIAAKQNATVALVEREQGAIQNSKFKIQNWDKGDKEDKGAEGFQVQGSFRCNNCQPTTTNQQPITNYPLPITTLY